jgi:hypothetical protein
LSSPKHSKKAFFNQSSGAKKRKRKSSFFGAGGAGGVQNEKKRGMQKAIHEAKFSELTKNIIQYRYGRMQNSKLTLFDIQATYPELAAALQELPNSFAVPTAFGVYLTHRAWNGIRISHLRGSRRSYVENLVRRYAKKRKVLSPTTIEIMRICDLRGGFLTYDLLVQALSVTRQFFKEEEKRAMERELAFLVERLRATGENLEATDLEFVEVATVHGSCKSQILRGWKHRNRKPDRGVNFLWALCPKCKIVLSLSEADLKPQLTP